MEHKGKSTKQFYSNFKDLVSLVLRKLILRI